RRGWPKITVWTLLNTAVLLGLGISKAILTFRGEANAAAHLDWALGTFWAVIGYWGNQFAQETPSVAPWLFEDDYTVGV
ncbi:hypothetical protein C8R43DRAFT_846107, partial [Mycena crocata]